MVPGQLSADVILVDVGGVILKSAWELLLEQGVSGQAGGLLGPLSAGLDCDWAAWRDGELDEHAYWTRWVDRVRASVDPDFGFKDPIRDIYLTSAQPIRHLLIETAGIWSGNGHRVAAVSNGVRRRIGVRWFESQPELAVFSHLFEAHEVGYRKPSADFFISCAEHFKVGLGDLFFIDDNWDYVRAARDVGVRAQWFRVSENSDFADL